jgi:replicative DNA helicase
LIVLAQVSRAKGGGGESELDLTAARGSGVIEEAADFVLALFQEEKAESFSEPEYDLICKILKNRKGPRNSAWVLDMSPNSLQLRSETTPYVRPGKTSRGMNY